MLAAVATVIGLLGFVAPQAIRPVFTAWMVVAFPIGWVVSHVLLGAIFYLVFTPMGLVMRATGWDPMTRRFEPEAETYWIEREQFSDKERYFRQF